MTEDVKETLRCGSPGITLYSCGPYSWGLRVPYEGKRITHGCVIEDVAGSLRCGSPGIALCGCSSYSGGLVVPNGEESPEIPGGLGDCRQATTTKIASVWKCMVRLQFMQ